MSNCTQSLASPFYWAGGLNFRPESTLDSLAGHVWTVGPAVVEGLSRLSPAPGRHFETVLQDPTMGSVRLTGILDEPAGADSLLLIVHGHGANANSGVCSKMAQAARRAGIASLRLSLRGADLSGDDIYHGGLTEDVSAALASPELRGYRKIFLAGYSVGGQIVFRCALDHIDDRIRAVAAICSPLNIAAAADEIDRNPRNLYRSFVLAGLNKVYAATAAKRPLPTPVEVVRRARFVRERDALTVVPRFGFRSVDDYYQRIQVCDELHRLDTPSLLVLCENDPIVPMHTLRTAINRASGALSVISVKSGGHMSFPQDLDLGQPGLPGLENQVTRWLLTNQ